MEDSDLDTLYEEINKGFVYRFFNEESKGETIFFVIDEDVINEFSVSFTSGDKKKLLNCLVNRFSEDWDYASSVKNELPQFFGLIALQVYAAFCRQNGDSFTDAAYLPQLSQLLNGMNLNKIERLFKKYQDELWINFKNWANQNHYEIIIPEKKRDRNRYVQYPLSQALFRVADLKKMGTVFDQYGLIPHEPIHKDDFNEIINNAARECAIFNSSYIKRLIKNQKKRKGIIDQIYRYYLKWDGEVQEVQISQKSVPSTPSAFGNIYFDECNMSIIVNPKFMIDEIQITKDGVFDILEKHFRLKYKDILFFGKDDDYEDFWAYLKGVEKDKEYILLLKINSKDLKELEKEGHKIEKVSSDCRKVKTIANSEYLLKKYLQKKHISISGGLKIDPRIKWNAWIEGGGPDIISQEDLCFVWINKEKSNFKEDLLYNLPVGDIELKFENFSPIGFSIEPSIQSVEKLNSGWLFNNNSQWGLNSDLSKCQISGLKLKENFEKANEYQPIREWIKVNLKISEIAQDLSDPAVIKALKRGVYGTRK